MTITIKFDEISEHKDILMNHMGIIFDKKWENLCKNIQKINEGGRVEGNKIVMPSEDSTGNSEVSVKGVFVFIIIIILIVIAN